MIFEFIFKFSNFRSMAIFHANKFLCLRYCKINVFYVNNNKNSDLALMNKLQWVQRKSQLICEVCGIPAGPQMQNNSI